MSGIESLVTQVKPNSEHGQQRNPNQLVITVDEPEPQPRSCWSRFFCCGAQEVKQSSSTPPPYKGAASTVNDDDEEEHSIDIDDTDCRNPNVKYLLPERPLKKQYKKTLVLDLDETLVHSSFKEIYDNDFEVSINLEGVIHRVFVRKRPYVDLFLEEVSKKWEVVLFTASLAKYADPLLDILDKKRTISSRLFRESCVAHAGNYVKDLRTLGRNMKNSVIIDNSPMSYLFQPHHAVPITTWYNDKSDTQLLDLLPLLDKMADCDDVRTAIADSAHLFVEGGIIPNPVVPEFKLAPHILKRQNSANGEHTNKSGQPAPLVIPRTPSKSSNGLLVVAPPETPSTPHINQKTGRSVLNSPMNAGGRQLQAGRV